VQGSANQLAETVNATGSTDAIERALPGTTKSAYDVLADCL
jgi:hypothetical protein